MWDFKNFTELLEFSVRINYNKDVNKKESTHSKSGCRRLVLALNKRRPSCWQTGWAFSYLRFLLSRKVSSATTKPPNAINSPRIPRTTITIS